MPVRWVVRLHEPTLERITAGLRDSAGVVLIGAVGVGKTELARAAADATADARWVAATAPARVVPFGALQRQIDVADVGKTAALLRAARESLHGLALLVVDDAHILDKLSATLVYQLAAAGSPRLLVTVDSAQSPPEPVSALLRDGLLTAVDVEPLDRDATAGLLHSIPGAETAPADKLYRLSGGNPLHLRHLVGGEPTGDLRASIGRYLMSLVPEVKAVLECLAVEDPLTLADLTALTGPAAVDQARAAGAVLLDGETVRPAHPLYTETLGDHLSAANRRRIRTELVERLLARPAGDVVDRLRLAVLALDSDTPQPVGDVIVSAIEALRLGDYELSERLARASLERSGALSARLSLAHALAWQGRGRDAEAVLSEVDPARLNDADLMAWALPRAANQFWMLSEPERATAFLRTIRNRVAEAGPRITLDALSATFAMNAGNVGHAVKVAHAVLASPSADDQAVAWAASAAALCSARQGRFDDVETLAQRALAAEHPGLLRFTIGLGQTTALLMAGQLDEARQLAQQFTDFAELQQPGRSIGEVLLAHVLIAEGEFGQAAALLGPAAATLERTGYSWGPLSLMLLATALAQQEDIAAAAKALSRAESRHGTKSALFTPELGVARAWRMASVRDSHGAVAAARDAARMAERGGQSAVALRAWYEAVRLGDIRAADPLARLAGEIDCVVGEIALAHARALATGDGAALHAVAQELAAVGMRAAAADAAAQAQQCG
jgi:hypothetical protein